MRDEATHEWATRLFVVVLAKNGRQQVLPLRLRSG